MGDPEAPGSMSAVACTVAALSSAYISRRVVTGRKTFPLRPPPGLTCPLRSQAQGWRGGEGRCRDRSLQRPLLWSPSLSPFLGPGLVPPLEPHHHFRSLFSCDALETADDGCVDSSRTLSSCGTSSVPRGTWPRGLHGVLPRLAGSPSRGLPRPARSPAVNMDVAAHFQSWP